MQLASLLAGLAISQTRTALAHAISYQLTLAHGVPHGLACSFTLDYILKDFLENNNEINNNQRELLNTTLLLLQSLNLKEEIEKYIRYEILLTKEPELNERMQNYSGKLQMKDIFNYYGNFK